MLDELENKRSMKSSILSENFVIIVISSAKVTVLIEEVKLNQKLKDGSKFYGVCGVCTLPERCWSKDSKQVIFSTPASDGGQTYVINIGNF